MEESVIFKSNMIFRTRTSIRKTVRKLFGRIITLALPIVIAVLLSGTSYFLHLKTHFVCTHPKYEVVAEGLNQDEIKAEVGEPRTIMVKTDTRANVFNQGSIEQMIQECWIYKFFAWAGAIEIYFDENGSVVGKKCDNA